MSQLWPYSSVVGGSVLIVGNKGKGPMVGQIAHICHHRPPGETKTCKCRHVRSHRKGAERSFDAHLPSAERQRDERMKSRI